MTKSLTGSILGTAVGDAIGLPYEGLSPQRAQRLLGEPDRHRLLFGHGMVSDDTEHACMVAQAMVAAGDDAEWFTRDFAWRLRFWLLGLPAGTGLATLRACLRLCRGVSTNRSGVFSAGNGPAMRAPIIGAAIDDLEQLKSFVRAATRITHTDPKAEHGALAVALAARLACGETSVAGADFIGKLRLLLHEEPEVDELLSLLESAVDSVSRGDSTTAFAAELGLANGVSGYVNHTVPVVVHAWLQNQQDYRQAVESVVRCGGDADSTAAMVGGIVGCHLGKPGIPEKWLQGLCEWPRTVNWMERLANQLSDVRESRRATSPIRLSAFGVIARNLLFLAVVLTHAFRRLFPAYWVP